MEIKYKNYLSIYYISSIEEAKTKEKYTTSFQIVVVI